MFSSDSGTSTERKSTWRYQFSVKSPDGKLLFDYLVLSGLKNSLDATSLWFGKNKARHPTSEIMSCSETNTATNINSPQQESLTYSRGRMVTSLLPPSNTGEKWEAEPSLSTDLCITSIPSWTWRLLSLKRGSLAGGTTAPGPNVLKEEIQDEISNA